MLRQEKRSKAAFADEIHLFKCPTTERGIDKIEYVDVRPNGQGGCIEFNIPATNMRYVDLYNTKLALKVRIVKGNNQPIEKDDHVALVDNALSSLFSQCDVSIQQKNITPNVSTNYPYKSFFDTLMDTERGRYEKESQLFMCSETGDFDDAKGSQGSNYGYFLRQMFTENGKVCDLEGKINMDICQQKRYLLNGMQINIKFWPSRSAFCLSSELETEFEVNIVDAKLRVCYINLKPEMYLLHEDFLKEESALYPYTKSDIKAFNIPQGQYAATIDDIFLDGIPSKVLIGIVAGDAYAGDYKKSPFKFHNYNCNFAALYVEGQSVPSSPYQPNFKGDQFIDCYAKLREWTAPDIPFTRREFKDGFCLYAFDIQPEIREHCLQVVKRGHTRLEMKFAQPLPEAVTIICYSKFPGLMSIDHSREVVVQ